MEGKKMRRIIGGTVLAFLLSTTAFADTSSMNADVAGMGILENNWIRAGVNGTTGTFGSGNGTSPGLLFDPTGTGTFDPSYDYLTPGAPFDGFAVKIDGVNKVNNNAGNMNQIPNCDCRMGETMFDGNNHLIWGGMWEHGGGTWEINNTYTLGETSPYIDVETEIIAGSDATTLSFGKFIDPDSQGMPGDSSSTDNVLGYGVIPSTNVAFSEATVSRYALGIYTTDTNVTAGINGWSTQADYAYIFGPSAFDAADDAITGGAGGGADVSSWGTLEDVGSATDAASGGGSTPEPVITTDTIVDTSRPVLTASITHHTASETTTVQTIDRETTTTTTTPMRTVTYTDGVETSSVVATSTISSAITDPGSFTGRIDQVASAQDVTSSALRSLTFEGVQGIGMDSTMNNGMTGSTRGFQAGGTITTDNGLIIGAGGALLSAQLEGNDDNIDTDTTVVAFKVARNIENGNIAVGVRHAMTDYTFNRTIGNFSNSGETSGTDTSISFTFEGNGEKLKPVLGYTRGRTSIDSYIENGSIQSARAVSDLNEDYSYATIGGRLDIGLINITALHHTDGVNDVSVGIEKETGNVTFNVTAHRSMTDLGGACFFD